MLCKIVILYYSSAMIFYPVASFCHYTPYYPVKGTQVGIIREPLREVGIQIIHTRLASVVGFCERERTLTACKIERRYWWTTPLRWGRRFHWIMQYWQFKISYFSLKLGERYTNRFLRSSWDKWVQTMILGVYAYILQHIWRIILGIHWHYLWHWFLLS